MRGKFRPDVQLTRTARSLRRPVVRSGIGVYPSFAYLIMKSMGVLGALGVNMRLRYAGVQKLHRSEEAYFQAYLVLWVRRIDTTAHLYSYAAHLKMCRRNSFEYLALCRQYNTLEHCI